MTVRIAYNLFTQRPKQELEDFERWTDMLKPGQGTDFYRRQRRRRDAGIFGGGF